MCSTLFRYYYPAILENSNGAVSDPTVRHTGSHFLNQPEENQKNKGEKHIENIEIGNTKCKTSSLKKKMEMHGNS